MKPAIISLCVLAAILAGALFSRAHVVALCDDTLGFLEEISDAKPDADTARRARKTAERWDGEAAFLDTVIYADNVIAVRCALRAIINASECGSEDELATAKAQLSVYLDAIKSGQEVDLRNIF